MLSVTLYVWLRLRRLCRPWLDPRLMPIEDRPPGAAVALPRWLGRPGCAPVARYALRGYVVAGLAELEDYLAAG